MIPFPTTQIEETFDDSAFFGTSGCMKCLRKDELMLLIGGVVKDQVAGLHSQIDSQNQRILMVRNFYGRGRGTGEGGASQDQVAELHSQIDSQNQRILMVRNLYGREKEKKRGKGGC